MQGLVAVSILRMQGTNSGKIVREMLEFSRQETSETNHERGAARDLDILFLELPRSVLETLRTFHS